MDRTPCNASPLAWWNIGCFYVLTWLKTPCKWGSHKHLWGRCPCSQQTGHQGGVTRLSLPFQQSTKWGNLRLCFISDIWTLIAVCDEHAPCSCSSPCTSIWPWHCRFPDSPITSSVIVLLPIPVIPSLVESQCIARFSNCENRVKCWLDKSNWLFVSNVRKCLIYFLHEIKRESLQWKQITYIGREGC